MPLYDYRCPGCGSFEARADASAAGLGASCPSCGAAATRVFGAPGGRGPRRQRQLASVSDDALRRVDRAEGGVASVGALPAGVPLNRGGKPRLGHRAGGDRRPWQLGH